MSSVAVPDRVLAWKFAVRSRATSTTRAISGRAWVWTSTASGPGAGATAGGASEAPPLFVVGQDGQAQLVNYRYLNGYYVVDRLIDVAELRLGEKRQTVVRITRTGKRS